MQQNKLSQFSDKGSITETVDYHNIFVWLLKCEWGYNFLA